MNTVEILLMALLLDGLIGDPDRLWRRFPHPVALMGRAIGFLDRRLNKGQYRKLKGVVALIVLLGTSGGIGLAIASLNWPAINILLTAILLAQNSLVRHIRTVARALEINLDNGREAVAMIVGRDPQALDENAVVRSAVESAAENFSDGLVAPAFWALLFGLPGIMVYKMVNTADSMIGYRNEKYSDFGWAAARLDDVINWIPARLAGLLICASHGSVQAFRTMMRDAPLHRSPNAGWPESATAAVLGIAISGPRTYGGEATSDPYVNAEGRYDLIPTDIDHAARIIWRAWVVLTGTLLVIWILI